VTEDSMVLQPSGAQPSPDPGNSDPSKFTEDLTDDEVFEANAAVEAAIKTLPVDNGGVL